MRADPRRKRSGRRTGAFTLIEILVVVSIIGILAILLSPALARAQASARSAGCQANLHQLGTSLSLYAADNDGFIVYDTLGDNGAQGTWADALRPYFSSAAFTMGQRPINVFACPESKSVVTKSSKTDYSKNASLNGEQMGTTQKYKLSQVVPASQIIALADGEGRKFSDTFQVIVGRHHGLANLLYFDGHVASSRPEDFKLVRGQPPLMFQ